jgi:hypothetical protein
MTDLQPTSVLAHAREWPEPVAAIYDRALMVGGESAMLYGPAHIVWHDENFDTDSIQWCLDHFVEWCLDHFIEHSRPDKHTAEQLVAVRQSLVELLALPTPVLAHLVRRGREAEWARGD